MLGRKIHAGIINLGAQINDLTRQAFGQDTRLTELSSKNLHLTDENNQLIAEATQLRGLILGLNVKIIELGAKIAEGQYEPTAADRTNVRKYETLLGQQKTTIGYLEAQLEESEENVRYLLKDIEARNVEMPSRDHSAPPSYDEARSLPTPRGATAVTGHAVTTYFGVTPPQPSGIHSNPFAPIAPPLAPEPMQDDSLEAQMAHLTTLQAQLKVQLDAQAKARQDVQNAVGQSALAEVAKNIKAAQAAEARAMENAVATQKLYLGELAKLVVANEIAKQKIALSGMEPAAIEAALAVYPSFSSAKEALTFFSTKNPSLWADGGYTKQFNEALTALVPFGKTGIDVANALKDWTPPQLSKITWTPKPAPVVYAPVSVATPAQVFAQAAVKQSLNITPLAQQSTVDVVKDVLPGVPQEKSRSGVIWPNYKSVSDIPAGGTKTAMLEAYKNFKDARMAFFKAEGHYGDDAFVEDIKKDNAINIIDFVRAQNNFFIQRAALEAFYPARAGEPYAARDLRQGKSVDNLRHYLPAFLLETIELKPAK